MSFNNKIVLVTGASSGIGAAIAIKFAEEGAKVAIVGRNQEKLKSVAAKCGNPLVIVADVTKDEDCKRIVNETIKQFGELNVLVNNAGIVAGASITEDHAMEVFDKVMNTNLRPIVYITNLAVQYLIKSKGNIINISSIASLHTIPKGFSYCVSKAALDHFTRSVAQELASSGVRVNSINPGPVRTNIIKSLGGMLGTASHEEASWDNLKILTALNRVSDPEEIADLVLFVASDKAKAMTGSSYVTDNGTLLNGS